MKTSVLSVLLLIFADLSLVAEAREAVPIDDPPPPPAVLPDEFVAYAEVGCDGTDRFCVPGTQDRTKQIGIDTNFSGAFTGTLTVLPGSTAEQGFDYALLNGGQCNGSAARTCIFGIEVFAEPPPPEHPHETFEILAKDVAYRDWSVGDDIEDQLHRDGYALSRLGYRVDRAFFPGFGFQAFGLSANEVIEIQIDFHSAGGSYLGTLSGKVILYDHDRPPILIVRGTEPQTINDWFASTDATTVGRPQYDIAEDEIEKWLNDLSDPEKNGNVIFRPHLTGHSLGGALSQVIAAYYTEAGGRLGQIVTFNSPGIARADVARFRSDRAVSVTHHTMRGDLVTFAGKAYLPRGASQDGSAFQTHPVWVEYGYPGYSGPPDNILGIMLDKHLLPMITAFIKKPGHIRLRPPSIEAYPQQDSVAFLQSPFYNYWSDPGNPRVGDRDYLVFMTKVAALQQEVVNIMGERFTGPNLVRMLSFRGTFEDVRRAIGNSLFRDQVVTPALRMWERSGPWGPAIWEAFRIMTGNPSSILPKSANAGLNATGNAAVPFATHFWEAVAQWPVAAWDASPDWGEHAWEAMTEWTPRQWATTVQPGFDWNTTRNRDANWWKDFAELPAKTIKGIVYNDQEPNGKNENEPGLGGRLVFLDENKNGVDDDQFRAQSENTGAYTLTIFGLPNNADYQIRQVLPDPQNWIITEPPLAENHTHVAHFNDDDKQIIESVNFGNHCFGDCGDDTGTTETIVINDHAFLRTYTDVPREGPVNTGIPVSQWVCGVVGFESQGGQILENGSSAPLWQTALVAHGTWHITVSFSTTHLEISETWPRVDILCFSTAVASLDAPEPGKPVFRQTFGSEDAPLAGAREHDLKISTQDYACGLVGALSTGVSDINEDGAGRIVQLNLYEKNGTWRASPDFRSHNTLFGIGGHEDWVIDVLCISTALAAKNGQLNKAFFVDRYRVSDSIAYDTRISSDHYACGVVGFVAHNGDIFEGKAKPDDTLVKVYAIPEDGSWHIHADFRTHKGRHETWEVDLLCAARGLIAFWPFDGNAADLSGNGNHGIVHGRVTDNAGKFGSALRFDGQSSYVELPNNPSLEFDGSFTLETWLAPELQLGELSRIFMRGTDGPDSATNGWGIALAAINRDSREGYFASIVLRNPALDYPAEAFSVSNTDQDVSSGAWHHVAMVWDRATTTLTLYVDGRSVASRSDLLNQPLRTSQGDSHIGRHFNLNDPDYYRGKIDQTIVWNRALSAEEIAEHAGKPIGEPMCKIPGQLCTSGFECCSGNCQSIGIGGLSSCN